MNDLLRLERIKQLLRVDTTFLINKINLISGPPDITDAETDGLLISEIMITQHGLDASRYSRSSLYQRDYIDSVVRSITVHFLDHLDKLVQIKNT